MTPSAAVDHQRLEAGLQTLLGCHAAVACRSTDGDVNSLAPIERHAVSRAIPLRQKEFAAGRTAARDAMTRLGRPAASVPVQDDRSPHWPEDLVGSISHSRATCVAVVALKLHWLSVGVDVEADNDLPRELWSSIGLPIEIQHASELPEAAQARWMMRIFSAKEAYYKWLYPQTQRILGFHDVEIIMKSTLESSEFLARPLNKKIKEFSPNALLGNLMIEQQMIISSIIR